MALTSLGVLTSLEEQDPLDEAPVRLEEWEQKLFDLLEAISSVAPDFSLSSLARAGLENSLLMPRTVIFLTGFPKLFCEADVLDADALELEEEDLMLSFKPLSCFDLWRG